MKLEIETVTAFMGLLRNYKISKTSLWACVRLTSDDSRAFTHSMSKSVRSNLAVVAWGHPQPDLKSKIAT